MAAQPNREAVPVAINVGTGGDNIQAQSQGKINGDNAAKNQEPLHG